MGACRTLSVVDSDDAIEITRQVDAVEATRAAIRAEGDLTVNVGPEKLATLVETTRDELPQRSTRVTLPPIASILPAVRTSRPASDPLLPLAMQPLPLPPKPRTASGARPIPQYIRRHAPPPSQLKKLARAPEDKVARAIVFGIWSFAALLIATLAVLVR